MVHGGRQVIECSVPIWCIRGQQECDAGDGVVQGGRAVEAGAQHKVQRERCLLPSLPCLVPHTADLLAPGLQLHLSALARHNLHISAFSGPSLHPPHAQLYAKDYSRVYHHSKSQT